MKRYDNPLGEGKNPDFEIVSGVNKGKTVDALYTTANGTQKEIDGLNQFYEKSMTVPNKDGVVTGIQTIDEHIAKADFVPVDFRVLNSSNQAIFLNYMEKLSPEQKAKIIIVR